MPVFCASLTTLSAHPVAMTDTDKKKKEKKEKADKPEKVHAAA